MDNLPIDGTTPPAAPSPPAAAPGPPTPPVPPPPAPPPSPAFENGGNVTNVPWHKSIDWLQVGLIFLGSITLLSVMQYHRLKIRNLKTEIPAQKKKLEELQNQISDLENSKVDKKQTQKQDILGL